MLALFTRLRPLAGQVAMAFAADTLPLAETRAQPVTRAQLDALWDGSPARLAKILDDLVASGDVATTGRGRGTRYTLDG
ncbi:MAG: hypothetical protein R3F65_25560 [bacterium]